MDGAARQRVVLDGLLQHAVAVDRETRYRVRRRRQTEGRIGAVHDARRRFAVHKQRCRAAAAGSRGAVHVHAIRGRSGRRFHQAVRVDHRCPAGGIVRSFQGTRAQVGSQARYTGFRERSAGIARVGAHVAAAGAYGRAHVGDVQPLRAPGDNPVLLELVAPIAVVSNHVGGGRRAAGVGHQLYAQVAIDHADGGALGKNGGAVGRGECTPTDGQCAIKACPIGFVEHVLNGGQRRACQRRESEQPRGSTNGES